MKSTYSLNGWSGEGGYRSPSSTGHTSTSGRYHGGSSGSFGSYGGSKTPAKSYGKDKVTVITPSKGGPSGSSYHGYHSSGKVPQRIPAAAGGKKGVPAFMDRDGALFDAFYNHIPTEKVPFYSKGQGWTPGGLISFNMGGFYPPDGYDSYIAGGSHRPDFSFDVNPYKEMLKEMQKLRLKNLELGSKALSDEAGEHYRQAYINHQKSLNNLSERLYNNGSTGGITESTMAYMDSAYKNALSGIEKEKLKGMGQLQNQYAEGSAKDQSVTMDNILKQMEKLRSERNAYERMLEERRYRDAKEERDFRRRLFMKYYGI